MRTVEDRGRSGTLGGIAVLHKGGVVDNPRVLRDAILLLLALAARQALPAEPDVVWRETAVLSAEEASQAAASDERFVYAIGSKLIAKYDRQTGRRVATSTGDTQHLNSGFFWKGRLLCAHSNYPQLPERSQIKVLDPDSMRITTFHEFGNYGGSLTWVLRDGDFWWCFFARYGRNNGESFLVKFDDQWLELKRWFLPPGLLGSLGKYSLSGGVWYQGSLLATDHDHRTLYRLQVPAEGDRLILLEKQPAPFPGQGIAVDLSTGGLVGINRAKRAVVFATAIMQRSGSPYR